MGSSRSRSPTRIGRSALLFDTALALALTLTSVLAVQVAIDTAPPGYVPPSSGLVLLLTTALLLNNLRGRPYPHVQTAASVDHSTQDPAPSARSGFTIRHSKCCAVGPQRFLRIESTTFLASPNSIMVLSRKNTSFSTPA